MLKYSYDTRPEMTYLVEIPPEYIDDSHLSYENICQLLQDDEVDLGCIQSIRSLNKQYNAYQLVKENSKLKIEDEISIVIYEYKQKPNEIAYAIGQIQAEIAVLRAGTPITSDIVPHLETSLISDNVSAIERMPTPIPVNARSNSARPRSGSNSKISRRQNSQWGASGNNLLKRQKSMRAKVPKGVDQQIDLCIFHSAPLIKKDRDNIIPLHDSTLDFEVERRLILETLKRNDIGADIRFDAATTEKLIEVLELQPKIIHISCHGYYDQSKGNCFYLAFEHQTQVGVLDGVTEQRLKKLLQQTRPYDGVIFVSACYSGAIGQVFLDAGFPCVICVHSKVQILDDAAKRFAGAFYRTILTGKSVQQSFDSAKALVEDQQTTMIDSCCCSHVHKPGCKWYERHLPADQMHAEHVPKCRCIGNNNCIHSMSCTWAMDFISKFCPDREFTDKEYDTNKFVVCCCSPEIPHGEGLKFDLKVNDESFLDKVLFPKHNKDSIETVAMLPESFRPPYLGKQVLGRHVEIQQIVEMMSSTDSQSRVIFLTGEAGLGKSDVIKTAAMYSFERRIFTDGVIYCDLKNRTDSSAIVNTVVKQLNVPGITNKGELLEAIRSLHICIIYDNASHLSEVKSQNFSDKIRYLVENTLYPKFVVISTQSYIWDIAVELKLLPLSNEQTIKLLKSLVGSKKHAEIDQKADAIIQIIGNYPKKIEQIAPLIRDQRIDDFIKEMNAAKSNSASQRFSIFNSMDILKAHNSTAHQLLKLLCCFSVGLFATDLEFLLKEEEYDWREALEILTDSKKDQEKKNTSWLVACKTDVKKIKENHYTAIDQHKQKSMEPQDELSDNQEKAIEYLSNLSRGILLAMMSVKSSNTAEYDSHAVSFNAALGEGIWAPLDPKDSQEIAAKISDFPSERFRFIEQNFWAYTDSSIYQDIDVDEAIIEFLGEMYICVTSIFILMDKLSSAINFGAKALACCKLLKTDQYEAVLYLIMANAHLKQNDLNEAKKYSLEAQKKFRYIGDNDGYSGLAETYLLMGLMKGTEGFLDPNLQDSPIPVLTPIRSAQTDNSGIEFTMTTEELFDLAYRNFNKVGYTFGRARVLLMKAEWRISTKQIDELVLSYLKQGHSFFKDYHPQIWDLRCLIALGEYAAMSQNWIKARQNYIIAKKLAKSVKDRAQEVFIKDKLQYIFSQIRKESGNNITVLKGMPMVEKIGDEYKRIGPVARYCNSHLRQDIFQQVSQCHKEVNIRVDLLTRKTLQQSVEGSRILVLSSDVYSDVHLVCEGDCMTADKLTAQEIKSMLGTDLGNQGIDVVIFAQPQSVTLGEFFHSELDVPHVIAFDFPNLTCEDDHGQYNILTWQVIFNFTYSFFKHVIQNHSVREAVNKSIDAVKGSMMFIIQHFGTEMKDASIFDHYGPVLINSEDINHDKQVFSDKEMSDVSFTAQLSLGQVSNLSSSFGPSNLPAVANCFAGRHEELHETLVALKETKCVTVQGDSIRGSGKTHFCTTVGHFCRSRSMFPDGVYLFDLRTIFEVAKVEKLLLAEGINTHQNEYKSLLLIFDNIDKLVHSTLASFQLLLRHYIDDCGFTILMSKNSDLEIPNRVSTRVSIKPLSSVEAATMLVLYSRNLSKEEITKEETDAGIITLLQDFEGLKMCYGNPKRIMDLSEELKSQALGEVRVKHRLVSSILSRRFTGSRSKTEPPANKDFQTLIRDMNRVAFDASRIRQRASPRKNERDKTEFIMPQLESMRNKLFNPEIIRQALGLFASPKESKSPSDGTLNPNMPGGSPLLGFLKRGQKSPRVDEGRKVNFMGSGDESNNDILNQTIEEDQVSSAITPKSVLRESIKVLQKKKEQVYKWKDIISKSENK